MRFLLATLAVTAALLAGCTTLAEDFIDKDFDDYFKKCHPDTPKFDNCMKDALNGIRRFYETGVPKYNIKPFDPFHASYVKAERGFSSLGFSLTLRNVTESGWKISKVVKFSSNLDKYKIVYTQTFPDKYLDGDYDFVGNIFGMKLAISGKFTLQLIDLVQTTHTTWPPGEKLKTYIDVQTISNMKLHITNLFGGHSFVENVLDKIINTAWQPGFLVTRPLVNELVSTAFTEIFGDAARDLPLKKLFKPSTDSQSSKL